MATRNTDWTVLTCAGCKTLELVASLNDAGYEAWAPVTREIVRTSPQRTREEIAVPLMAGFVFASAVNLPSLLALWHSPAQQYQVWDSDLRRMVTRGHPAFRIFRGGNHPPVSDAALEPLRRLERKPRPKRIERTFSIGDRVRTDDGGFAGLNGTVTAIRGKNVVVAFGRWMEPEMPSWSLRPVDESGQSMVDVHQPERDAA